MSRDGSGRIRTGLELPSGWGPAGRGRGGGPYDRAREAQDAREKQRERAAAKRCWVAQTASRRSLEKAHVAVGRAYRAARRTDLYPESDVATRVDALLAETIRARVGARRAARAVGRAAADRDARAAERAAGEVERAAERARTTAAAADAVSRKAGGG